MFMDVLPKFPERLWEQIVLFPENYLNLLLHPKAFFSSLREKSAQGDRDIIISVFSFAFISLSIGTAVGGYLEISGRPQLFDVQAIMFVLFVWCITAVILHPFLKLFRASGVALQTMIVVLFSSAALHIVWIPVFGLVSKIVTETRVVLTYDYAISYSLASKRNWEVEGMYSPGDVAELLVPQYSESYIVQREPEKEGTVLQPAEKPSSREDFPARTYSERVAIASSTLPVPNRIEEAVLGPHSTPFLASILALYLLSHIFYMGIGFSELHGRSPTYWISLAILSPLAIVIFMIVGLAVFITLI